ncbi:hypothetical protein BVRB_5g106270 [Beta vulgaris subsp. vulgaris]|nr:hypothetical protein BVRB_5g106270 [Beta vulgaris subsp. vulgaris]
MSSSIFTVIFCFLVALSLSFGDSGERGSRSSFAVPMRSSFSS